jgi:hypothetical protein
MLRARWTGADSGTAKLAARASWCGKSGPLLVFATAGDTGIALAVYPKDSLLTGVYAVTDPSHGVPRPGAAVAARWARRLAASDLRGQTGQVTLRRGEGTISGSFETHAEGVGSRSEISISATFSRVPVLAGGPDCVGHAGVD